MFIGQPGHFSSIQFQNDQVSTSPVAFATGGGTLQYANGMETYVRDTKFVDGNGALLETSHTEVTGTHAGP